MGLVSKPYTFSAGASIIASEHNSNFDTIYNSHNGNISNSNISTSAAIAYSKLSLAGSILNADIHASAAIAKSKLSLTGAIVNADINSSAAIVDSKLAQITTAGKVSGASLTSLSSIPSGAGVIPAVNVAVKNILIMGSSVSGASTGYIGSSGGDSTSGQVAFCVPFDGVLKRLYVNIATGSSNTLVVTARKNGSDQSLTVSYGDLEEGVKSDTSNTVSYSAGDLLEFKVVNDRSVSQFVQISVEFDTA